MKVLTVIISLLAIALIVFNTTKINLDSPLQGQSIVAIITIVALCCVILMMLILRTSKRIEDKVGKSRK